MRLEAAHEGTPASLFLSPNPTSSLPWNQRGWLWLDFLRQEVASLAEAPCEGGVLEI